MIVPKEHLVLVEFWMLTTSDQCQDIASEEHFNNADAAIEIFIGYHSNTYLS